jgi:hypothetical protein
MGYGLQYAPLVRKLSRHFGVAAEHRSTNFVHLRYGSIEEPGTTLHGLEEVIACHNRSTASSAFSSSCLPLKVS